jgi:hypothetical protein
LHRRLFYLATLAVLFAALALPAATVAASPYTYRIYYDRCDGHQVNLKMHIRAGGATPADKLTIESWAQKKVGTSWTTVHTWRKASYKFEPDGRRHTLTSWRSYNGNEHYKFRIVFRLRVWDGSQQLASVTHRSVKC